MNFNPAGLLDFTTALVAAFYIGAVLWQGRFMDLLALLMTEAGFVQLVVSAFIVWQLGQLPVIGPLVHWLTLGAFLALALKVAGNMNTAAFTQFYNGHISLFELVAKLVGQDNITE